MAKNATNKITLLVNLKSEGGAQVAATISEAIKRGTKTGSANIQNILLPLLQDLGKSITTGREKNIKDPAAYVKSLEKNIKKFNNSFNTLIYSKEALEADKQRLEEIQKEIQNINSIKRTRTDSIYKTAFQSGDNLLDDKRAKSLKSLQKTLSELQKGTNKELLAGFDLKTLKNFDNLFLHLKEIKETQGTEKWTNALEDFYSELEKRYGRVKIIQEETYKEQRKNLPSLQEEQQFLQNKINDSENLTEETKEYYNLLQLISDLLERLKFSNQAEDISDKGLMPETSQNLIKETAKNVELQKEQEELDKRTSANVDDLVKKYLSLAFAFQMIQRVGSQMFNTIKEIDKALNEITVVSTYTTSQVWGMYDSFLAIANATGTASSEIIKVAGEYFKQGKSLTESLALTEAAAMAARVAGISATESVRYLTAALNGYGLAAEDALSVSDKFSKLAASSATDYSDLAVAMSKVAAQASSMGVEMDNLMGMMTTALEVTQEAPENIGTSFKTIFARMAEIKDLGIIEEDATSANRVAKALNSIGVALFDTSNQMRDLDDVLIEVGNKWEDLDNNTQRYLATILAGTRQQTRLMAVFENWDKTLGFIEDSSESEGATLAQNAKTYETVQYALERLNNAYEKFMTSLGSNDLLKMGINLITDFINLLSTPIGYGTLLVGSAGLVIGNLQEITQTLGKVIPALSKFGSQIVSNGKTIGSGFKMIWDSFNKGMSIENLLNPTILSQFNDLIGPEASARITNRTELINKLNKVTDLGNKISQQSEDALKSLGIALNKERTGVVQTTVAWNAKTAAMTAGLSAIMILIPLMLSLHKSTEKLNQELATSYSDQYNNKELINNVNDLVEEYEELNNKIIKTNEELEQMKSLQKQINEYTGGNMFDLNGNIDTEALENWENNSIEKQIGYLEEGLKNIDKLGGLEEVLGSDDASSAAMAKTIATIQELTGEYNNLEKAVKAYYEQLANDGYTEEDKDDAELRIKARTALGKEYNSITFTDIWGTEHSSNGETLTEIFKTYNENIDINKIINDLINKNNENLKELQAAYEALPQAVLDLLNATDNTVASSILSMEWTDNIETALQTQSQLLNDYSENLILSVNDSLSNLGFDNISEDQFFDLANIIQNIGTTGSNSFSQLQKFAQENELSLDELIDEYIKLGEEIYNIPTLDEQLNIARLSVKSIQDLNSAISDNTVTFDQLYSFLNGLSEEHRQQVVNDIVAEGQISAATAKLIQQAEIDKFNTYLNIQIKEKQAQKIAVESMIQQAQYMLDNINVLQDTQLENAINNYNSEMLAYQESRNRMLEMERQFQRNVEIIDDGGTAKDVNAFEAINAKSYITDRTTAAENLKTRLEQLKNEWNLLDSEISALEILKTQGDELFNLGEAFGSVANGAGDAADALEEYERQLNEVTAATERLNAINARMDLLNAYKDLYEGRDGAAYVKLMEQEIELLNEQSKAYENLIEAQKREQDKLKNGVEQAVLDVFEVIDGRLVPIMSKYNNLTDEQAKVADEFFNSYNELTDGINDNTAAIVENQNAIKELQEYKRDQTIELQKLIIEAIKAEQKAIYEAQKEALEKQKEYLEKRKQLYEDAFEEEDYNNELSELEEEKLRLQEQIAALAGATDSTSKQKRAELEQSLADILKEINDKTLEYNRDALLDSIDDEIAAKEEEQQTIEEIYNQRVEDYAWLQEQMELIAAEGWETILDYLKQWDEEYAQSTDLMKEKTEEEWKFLYETSNYYLNDTATNAKISFEKISSSLKAETDKMISYWNSVKAAAEAANAIKGSSSSSSSSYNNNSSQKSKTVYIYNGKEFPTKDAAKAYVTRNAAANDLDLWVEYSKIQQKTKYYSKGGYVKYTGLAMVHGSTNNPEAFLSAKDTKNFEALKIALNNSNLTNSEKDALIIEEINISTQSLNNNQDWNNAGVQLGNALKNALRNRGIVTNLKR